ncbi:chorion class A protein Ld2/Ld41-like [Hyposmocoma kahamanoa]|uniref:chorion class A protein Ld2/Ld41-like n=1 Tax=Hyposmocoma kahamanoa TaxID=1477025 RepID=UPI000E6D8227|nr:chorion class A protein Ld2/Ld41-like [Hyposmocoma kahamanoa]
MNSFAFLLLCAQACLIQAVYKECGYDKVFAADAAAAAAAAAASANAAAAANAAAFRGADWDARWAGPVAFAPEAYHGHGAGNVAVSGDLGVAGATLISGQVPVLGDVHFKGQVPAAGAVTISGSCGCGCGY